MNPSVLDEVTWANPCLGKVMLTLTRFHEYHVIVLLFLFPVMDSTTATTKVVQVRSLNPMSLFGVSDASGHVSDLSSDLILLGINDCHASRTIVVQVRLACLPVNI